MKLRFLEDSIRVRLKRSDLRRLLDTGAIGQTTRFDMNQHLAYEVVLDDSIDAPDWRILQHTIRITLPTNTAWRWAEGDEVGIYATREFDGVSASLIVEKDFSCRHETLSCTRDSFHPEALTIRSTDGSDAPVPA